MKAKRITMQRGRVSLRKEKSATLRIIEAEKNAEKRVMAALDRERQAVRSARYAQQMARSDALKWVAEREMEINHFLRAAHDEIGRKVGQELRGWMEKEYDPIANQRKKLADACLSAARIDFSARMDEVSLEQIAVVKCVVPRFEYNVAYNFGRVA